MIVIIILIFISILSVAIVAMLTISLHQRTNKSQELEHKIILENEMYALINTFTDLDTDLDKSKFEDYASLTNTLMLKIAVIEEEEDTYFLFLKASDKFQALVLRAKVEIDVDHYPYSVKAWGFIWT